MMRTCDADGKQKDMFGGKVCEKGHFICKDHAYTRSTCPLCGTRLK